MQPNHPILEYLPWIGAVVALIPTCPASKSYICEVRARCDRAAYLLSWRGVKPGSGSPEPRIFAIVLLVLYYSMRWCRSAADPDADFQDHEQNLIKSLRVQTVAKPNHSYGARRATIVVQAFILRGGPVPGPENYW